MSPSLDLVSEVGLSRVFETVFVDTQIPNFGFESLPRNSQPVCGA